MHLSITHETTYRYDPAVTYSIQSMRLAPRGYDGLSVQNWQVTSNGRFVTAAGEDGFGNIVHTLTNTGDHDQVHIQARGEVLTSDTNGVVKGLREPFRPLFYRRTTPLRKAQKPASGRASRFISPPNRKIDTERRGPPRSGPLQ